MANLRDMRLRMRAIRQTLQVTKAMNLISTSKLRKGRRSLEDVTPYFNRIKKSMYDILSDVGEIQSEFFRKSAPPKESRTAIIVIASDKGLAGSYNANIFHKVNELCGRVQKPLLILIGNIGYHYFVHSPHIILENFSFRSLMPAVEHAGEVAEYVISQYLWGVFDEVHLVYTHMFNTVKILPIEQQLLPLNAEEIQAELSSMGNEKREKVQFEFLPSEEAVFDALVPLYIKGIINGCLVEAFASEQSARMAAMDEASKSAEDMLGHLQISYNRARQAAITQEMSEIIGGSTALSDK